MEPELQKIFRQAMKRLITTSLTAKVYERTVSITEGKGVNTYVGRFYRFVPKTSGTYYFYSVSYNMTPWCWLYEL